MNLRQKKKRQKRLEEKNRKIYDVIRKEGTITLIKKSNDNQPKVSDVLRRAEISGPPTESMEHMLESIFPSFVDWIKDIPDEQIPEALEDLWENDSNKEK